MILCFQGRAGDRNARATPGAHAMAAAISARTGRLVQEIGRREPPLAASWRAELEAAREGFTALNQATRAQIEAGAPPVLALPRCAAALATLPAVVEARPDAAVVWFDAHADCNTPEGSLSGYLGGMILTGAAGLWETGHGAGLDLSRVVLVGARDLDAAEERLIETAGITRVSPGPDLNRKLEAALDGRPAFVHLDCDVLEPGLAPTEFSVPGGLSLRDLSDACEAIAESGAVGLEVAEFEAVWPHGAAGDPAPIVDALELLLRALEISATGSRSP